MSSKSYGVADNPPILNIADEPPIVEVEEGEYIYQPSSMIYDRYPSVMNDNDDEEEDEEDESVEDIDELGQRQMVVSRAFQQGTHYMSMELVLKGTPPT